MTDAPSSSRWELRPVPPAPRSIVELIGAGWLDAELAASLWVLIEARVPVVVACKAGSAPASTLLDALLDFRDPKVRVIRLAGSTETFDWLPQAGELGWSVASRGQVTPRSDGPPVRPDDTILFASDLSDALPSSTWGAEARLAIRAASIGYGLAATIPADSLDEVFEALQAPPVEVDDDELSRLGVVLVVRTVARDQPRVVAAHYVRPTVRDVHGHVQRLGPAVLTTWDASRDAFEHFGWGITPELAVRVGVRAGDFERDVDRRRDLLQGWVAAGLKDLEAVRRAIDASRPPDHVATPTESSPRPN